jgi:hypothetical protein
MTIGASRVNPQLPLESEEDPSRGHLQGQMACFAWENRFMIREKICTAVESLTPGRMSSKLEM